MSPHPSSGETRRPCPGRRGGFTLVESLVVVLVLGLVIALCIPALSDVARSSALQQGGQLVEGMAVQARQTAVSKGTLVALVILTEAGTEQDYRALTLVEYSVERGWIQSGSWEVLPEGVILDPLSQSSTLLAGGRAAFPLMPQDQPFPELRFQGVKLGETQVAACIFMPSGGRRTPENPAQLRLVQGIREGKGITYTNRLADGLPADFIDIAVVGVTGSIKTTRPS